MKDFHHPEGSAAPRVVSNCSLFQGSLNLKYTSNTFIFYFIFFYALKLWLLELYDALSLWCNDLDFHSMQLNLG